MQRLGLVLFAVLVAAACGGEPAETEVAEALAADLRSAEAFADDVSDDEARCVGDGLVTDLGADAARSIGRDDADIGDDTVDEEPFTLGALDDSEIDAIGDAMETCVEDLDAIVVDLVAAGILDAPDDDFPVTAEEATCVGEIVADQTAFGRLLALGLESGDAGDLGELTDDEAEVFAAAFTECVDVRTILLDQVASSGADPEVVACIDDEITDGAIQLLFVDTFAGNEGSAEQAFAGVIDSCT